MVVERPSAPLTLPCDASGVILAISTRADGNLSFAVADDPEGVLTRRQAFCQKLGIALGDVVCAQQVHGGAVARVGRADNGRGARERATAIPNVDAMIADEPDVHLMLTFADCTPIVLFDPDRPAVGLAHAGWRGTVAGIARNAVAAMRRELACEPTRMRALIGPAIGGCCYEVSPEVASAVAASCDDPAVVDRGRARSHVDLAAANRAQLVSAGLRAENVALSGTCTSCQVGRYFSHRAEAGRAGRFVALIGLRREGV